jgi:hypothetical protein
MRKESIMHSRSFCTALVTLVLIAATAPAQTLDEVIDKHIAAHGGRDAWEGIETIKLTGDYTAFSKVRPFTLLRKLESKYLLDHSQGDKQVIIGFDGDQAWWINLWYEVDWPQPVTGNDWIALQRQVDFYPTPLFDFQKRGFEATLIGATELEGEAVIQIDLTRTDGSKESWYLDPESFLEVARDSPGADFGQPVPERTYFDDFRQVGDVVIAHYVESEFYVRHRVMEVGAVELNVAIDDSRFALPIPAGMADLIPLAGAWKVKHEEAADGRSWQEQDLEATITSRVKGAMIELRYETADGLEIVSSLTYDRFRQHYRLATVNSFTTHLDIQQGSFDEAGRLTLSNVETGTSWTGFGRTLYQRTTILDITPDSFKIETEVSFDAGGSWLLNQKQTYTRPTS